MALLIGAFMIHGVIPGPFILEKQPQIFWGIVTSATCGAGNAQSAPGREAPCGRASGGYGQSGFVPDAADVVLHFHF